MPHGDVPENKRKLKPEIASYTFSRSAWGKKRKRWLHMYCVHPPESRPFLPSDEALKTLVGLLPSIRFQKSVRFKDRDFFLIYAANKNVFTTRARGRSREMRLEFLRDVANMAFSSRDIPVHVIEAANLFLSKCGFVSVHWTGSQVIASDAAGKKISGQQIKGGIYWTPFRSFERTCAGTMPFSFGENEAAHL